MLLLLFACSESKLTHTPGDFVGHDTAAPVDTGTEDTGVTAVEVCNGVDDDGDGEVDEGFPDDDGNGRADCDDATCPPLDAPAGGPIAARDVCHGPAAEPDPWHVRVLWEAATPSTLHPLADNAVVAPFVGQLDDDDGDGDIDGDDDPDVVIEVYEGSDFTSGTLVAIDGPTGVTKWEVDGVAPLNGVAVADIDGDGLTDVVATRNMDGAVTAWEGDGTPKWESPHTVSSSNEETITVVDWDGDGMPEVYVDDVLLDGATGAVETQLRTGVEVAPPAFADVDLDGQYELIGDGVLYNHDLTQRWACGGGLFAWPIPVQADDDPEPEVLFGARGLSICDDDGALLATVGGPSIGLASPPAIGDFDGDGAPEIAWASNDALSVIELDGTTDWWIPMDDDSTGAGPSGADLDGDGALEVLFADESGFVIVDGRTGRVDYHDTRHTSQTVSEYPIVVDLDHDGQAEILVVNSYDGVWGALVALTADGVTWTDGAPVWGVHDFDGEKVSADGTVPSVPPTPWLDDDRMRTLPTHPQPGANLTVAFTDVCVADCEWGPVALSVQVGNDGTADVPAGGTLEIYADDAGVERLVASATLPEVPASTSLAAQEFDLHAADVPVTRWIARVVAPSGLVECDTTDDEATDSEGVCP